MNAFEAILNPGDEVILPAPYWLSYPELIRLAGGVPVIVNCGKDVGYKLTADALAAAVTPKTKALVLNDPNNPTGAVYTKSALAAIAQIVVEKDFFVIADEMYESLVYGDAKHVSIASLGAEIYQRTITVCGLSKSYAMTGFRIGYVLGNKELIAPMTKIHQYCIMCSPSTSQLAVIEAANNGDEEIAKMRKEYNYRRNYLLKGLKDAGLECFTPYGAFYAFPSIKSTGLSSEEFCEKFHMSKYVAIVPGNAFGDCGEGYIRVSYAYSISHLKEAIRRITEFLDELKSGGESL
jgi:aminotransferase